MVHTIGRHLGLFSITMVTELTMDAAKINLMKCYVVEIRVFVIVFLYCI